MWPGTMAKRTRLLQLVYVIPSTSLYFMMTMQLHMIQSKSLRPALDAPGKSPVRPTPRHHLLHQRRLIRLCRRLVLAY